MIIDVSFYCSAQYKYWYHVKKMQASTVFICKSAYFVFDEIWFYFAFQTKSIYIKNKREE